METKQDDQQAAAENGTKMGHESHIQSFQHCHWNMNILRKRSAFPFCFANDYVSCLYLTSLPWGEGGGYTKTSFTETSAQ